MIMTRTPLRINFAAGGSDLPSYYRHAPGAVIGAAIDTHIYLCVKPNFDGRVMAHYRATEDVATVDDLSHTRMRACLHYFGIERGIEIASLADVPGSTGLGSSGAFTVGLLLALDHYTGGHEQLAHSPYRLAQLAYQIEVEGCGAKAGKQDHLFAAIGGAQHFQFHADEAVTTTPIAMSPDFAPHLLLVSTGIRRDADRFLAQPPAIAHVARIVEIAHAMKNVIEAGDIRVCGALLDEAWQHKRQIAPGITNATIDRIYRTAIAAGAWGGKLCGAGGGGFLLFLAPEEKHATIINALGLRHVPIRVGVPGSEVVWPAH